ncbi:nucleoid-associated protein [Aeromonas caviae]|uniref:nucleoid-associated protein n=1 Tax=Aeromonas caviae TaxID=648 RepID=UPI002B4A8F46|nr:nucleoid-associated protein [Aeromonas caviae]
MHIDQAILHRIDKERQKTGPQAMRYNERTELSQIDETMTRMAEGLLSEYGRQTSGYGILNKDGYLFPARLKSYLDREIDFIKFTTDATRQIGIKMQNQSFATGGFPLFLRYTNLGRDWLLIAMLKLKPGTGIDEDKLVLNKTLSFDIKQLHEAARIDIEKWKSDEQPYLSFVKKRAGDDDVSKYFREALGCSEYTDSKKNTETVIEALEDYFEEKSVEQNVRIGIRQKLYEHCHTKREEGEPVNLQSLSAILFDQEPEAFRDYVRDGDYHVSDSFDPHTSTYKKLMRISKTFGNIKIGFSVQDVQRNIVDYDGKSDSLVIRNPPKALVEEIRKHKLDI